MITSTTFAVIAAIASLITLILASREQDANQKKLADSITGGEGYCFVNITPDTPGKALVDVISKSEYPLYDVEVQIRPWLNLDDFQTEKGYAEAYRKLTNYNELYDFRVGTLPSVKSQMVTSRKLGLVPFDDKRRWFYTIDFTARNGEWTQIWELSLDEKGEPLSSHVIYKTVIENNTLKKQIILKAIHPKIKDSIIESLIDAYKPFK